MEEEWSVEACNSCGVHEGINEGILRQEEGCFTGPNGRSLSDMGTAVIMCRAGGQRKRVATIAACLWKRDFACPVSKWDRKTSPLDCL